MSSEQRQLFEAAIAATPPYPAERYAGRGIVICAGGARLFTCAYVAIGILRRVLACRLPIELWHLGEAEIGPPMRSLLEEFEVEVVDAFDFTRRHPLRIIGGWELKPYAIVHSRFREVFLLDADNLPLIDPASLFDLAQYAASGTVFWPDLVSLRADNPVWDICGVPYRDTPSVESGQVLLDKQRCWAALQLALHMNQHSDFFYQYLYGDKDTFLIAWLKLGQPYAMPEQIPVLRHAVLLQHDFRGQVIFQHRNTVKWFYGGPNPRLPGFVLEEDCFALLEELYRVWNGRVFNPPRASVPARIQADALRRVEWFTCLKPGTSERPLQLLDGNRIGEGRGENEFYWWVEEDGEGLLLGFEGRRRPGGYLRQQPDGSWRGHSTEREGWEIQLTPRKPPTPTADPLIESAVALLESVLASPAAKPGNKAAADEFSAALKVLRQSIPGFGRAIAERLANPAQALSGEALAALRAALAEPMPSVPVRGDKPNSPSWVLNIDTRYTKKG